jgi:hypothetical protein
MQDSCEHGNESFIKGGEFTTSRANANFSRRTLLYAVSYSGISVEISAGG